MSRTVRLALLLPLVALAACGSSSKSDGCSVGAVESAIHARATDLYLWRDELAAVDPAAYADPRAYLDALTAQPRAEGKDRHFSFLASTAAVNQQFTEGQALGYGLGYKVVGSQLLVIQTYPSSAVAAAGITRGDELVAIATTTAGLDAPTAQLSAILASSDPSALSTAFGSGQVSTRAFRVKKRAGATVDLTMTSSTFALDPVPDAANPIVLTAGAHRVGYLLLKTFIQPAEADLRAAAGKLKAAGVTDLIVDFRYNGGGNLPTMSVLLDLLGGARTAADLAFDFKFNPAHTGYLSPVHFAPEPNALSPGKIAFIVRGGSASASEDTVSALQPYLAPATGAPRLAIVGERTLGKPVGQFVMDLGCDLTLFLVSFQVVNAEGQGDFYQGLPDANFRGASCLAADDLAHDLGDPAEASVAAALQWIANGSCAAGPIPPVSAAVAAARRAEAERFEAASPMLLERFAGPTL